MKYNGEGVWEDEIHLVDVDTPVLGGMQHCVITDEIGSHGSNEG